MKINRYKNAFYNVVFGAVFKIISILGPFLIRTLMIYKMGNEYVGLNSLFTSILSFLSLTELGVGSALVYSMYKPIANDDKQTICALLNLYKKIYRIIGAIILVIGLALLPFLKYLIKADCPEDVNLYILYLIYIFNTVISYELFAYKQSLLQAYQRNDIISKRSAVLQILLYILQGISIVFTKNFYVYIIWMPAITIFTNLANAVITQKMFPDISAEGKINKSLERSIIKNVTALFGTKANSIVMHAADNIVISSFIGLNMVGLYGNYYYIMNALIGMMTVVYDSITAGLGNSIETETVEKNHRDFNMLTLLNFWLITVCSACLLCLYQPFMNLWVGKKQMLGLDIVILLVVYFYIYHIRRIVLTYKDAAGVWWQDRYRPYIMMVVNIVGNLVMVQFFGLQGVVLSTIVSMLISLPIENYTVFRYIFNCGSGKYYLTIASYTTIALVVCTGSFLLCGFIGSSPIGLVVKLLICLVVSNIVILASCYRSKYFKDVVTFVKSKRKKK